MLEYLQKKKKWITFKIFRFSIEISLNMYIYLTGKLSKINKHFNKFIKCKSKKYKY